MYQNAENLSRLCDFVAEADSTTNDQFARLNVLNSEGSLSDVYRYTLRMSQVIAEVTGAGPDRIAVITGPNLASKVPANG